jgi:3-phosphoshikimate 1-carboxyvinyltransferase
VAKRVDDDIVIKGGSPTGGVIDSYNDHRIVMSSAILSLISNSSVKILGANAVNKSYPTFFEDFTFLGGKVKKDV